MSHRRPHLPGPGQESVWDYPRPPRLEPVGKHLRVMLTGQVLAETRRGYRVLETSHPPCYYFPPDDVVGDCLSPGDARSFCEWKGSARYFHVQVGDTLRRNAAWSYPDPDASFTPIRDYLSFYAHLMDECTVAGEVVRAQAGGFYGGWVTADIVGPFKGGPGTRGW